MNKMKTRAFKQFRDTVQSFLKTTSLHGAIQLVVDGTNAITETKPTRNKLSLRKLQQIIWLLILGSCFGFCTFLIATIWVNNKNDVTRIAIGNTNFPIDLVDFPAVTICNNNKVYAPETVKIQQAL